MPRDRQSTSGSVSFPSLDITITSRAVSASHATTTTSTTTTSGRPLLPLLSPSAQTSQTSDRTPLRTLQPLLSSVPSFLNRSVPPLRK